VAVDLHRLRFAPERALHDKLFERFGLDVLIDHFVASGGVRAAYDVVVGSQLRLTPLLAPCSASTSPSRCSWRKRPR
jgi:hypothetical protein